MIDRADRRRGDHARLRQHPRPRRPRRAARRRRARRPRQSARARDRRRPAAFLAAWAEERDRQFREEVPRVPRGRHRAARRARPRSPARHGAAAGRGALGRRAAAELVEPGEVDVGRRRLQLGASSRRMSPVADAARPLEQLAGARLRASRSCRTGRSPLTDRPLRRGAGLAAVPPRDRRLAARRHDQAAPVDLPRGRGGARARRRRGATRILHVGDDWAADVVGGRGAGWRIGLPPRTGRWTRRCRPPSPATTRARIRRRAGPGDRRAGRPRRARRADRAGAARRARWDARAAAIADSRSLRRGPRLACAGCVVGWSALDRRPARRIRAPGSSARSRSGSRSASPRRRCSGSISFAAPPPDRLSRRLAPRAAPRRLGRGPRRRLRRDARQRHLPAADRAVPDRARPRRGGHADRAEVPPGVTFGSLRELGDPVLGCRLAPRWTADPNRRRRSDRRPARISRTGPEVST